MSTESDIKAAFAASTANVVTPETMATFKAQMEAKGLDPSGTLAKFSAQQPSAPPQSKPTAYAPDIDPATKLPRLTSEQTAQAAETLRKFWTGDPKVLEDALKGAGVAPVSEPVADTRSDEARDFDASSLASARPEEYALDGAYVGRGQIDPAMDRTIRTALGELSVAKSLGRATVGAFLDSGREYSAVAAKGDLAVKQYHLEESAKFARINRVGWQQAAAEMKPWLEKVSPATREYLAKSGAIESAAGRTHLYQAFQLATARSKMGGKS